MPLIESLSPYAETPVALPADPAVPVVFVSLSTWSYRTTVLSAGPPICSALPDTAVAPGTRAL